MNDVDLNSVLNITNHDNLISLYILHVTLLAKASTSWLCSELS